MITGIDTWLFHILVISVTTRRSCSFDIILGVGTVVFFLSLSLCDYFVTVDGHLTTIAFEVLIFLC